MAYCKIHDLRYDGVTCIECFKVACERREEFPDADPVFRQMATLLFPTGPFRHVHETLGYIHCPKCPCYGGRLKGINEKTTLDEMFCEEGFKEVKEDIDRCIEENS